VRGGWAAIEQTGGRQRQRAGAYREYLRTLAVLGHDPIYSVLIVAGLQGGNDDIVGTIRWCWSKVRVVDCGSTLKSSGPRPKGCSRTGSARSATTVTSAMLA
jgi:hypothetical protein